MHASSQTHGKPISNGFQTDESAEIGRANASNGFGDMHFLSKAPDSRAELAFSAPNDLVQAARGRLYAPTIGSPRAMSLALAKLDPKREVLKDVFGFDGFRPGQERVIDALLNGRNVLTVMPTGSGKSLCFQVPALVLGGLTVVVSPLLALMQDQVQALKLAGVAADTINSGQEREANVAAWRRAAAGETRLLYLSPERLMTERMLAALGRLDVRLIAIDEAHCVSQWGPAFRPEYQMLARLDAVFPNVPMVALTATADEVTRADIALQLFGNNVETFVLGFDRPNIHLKVEPKRNWHRQMLDFVERHKGQSGIVYCLSRKRTEEAAELLCAAGIRALAYHAGMDKDARGEPERVHDRAGRRDGRDDRVRDGYRQARRALRLSCRSTRQFGGVLSGIRPRRPRRQTGRGAHAVRPRRHPPAPHVHRRGG
jgi:superfamily II DNA helicase RecQ